MARYIVKRLLLAVLVVICVAFVVFSIMALTPSSPGRMILGSTASQEAVDAMNEKFGYNQPFLLRFINWLKDVVLHLDFGDSYRTQQPVFQEIFRVFPVTLRIALYASIFSVIVGIPLGVLSAVKQYSLLDGMMTVCALLLSVVPGFWLGLLLISLFSLTLGLLPPNGADSFLHYVLPTMAVSAGGIAYLMRLSRSSMLETIRADYVRTAMAKGASERSIIWKHALPNAMLPVIVTIGTSFASMLGGAVITETVFAMPGLGTHILSAIQAKDIPVVMAGVTLLSAVFSLVVVLVDIVSALLDPRVKAKYAKSR